MAFFLLGGLTLIGVGCSKDYDDDIAALNQRIDATNVSLDQLKSLIESGAVISSVKNNGDGITITLSDGSSYTLTNGKDGADGANGANGKDGVDGTNGKDAVVWTIGSDGYWYQDGDKTEYKAIGTDGKDGANGKDGAAGADGTNGANGQDGKDGADGNDGKDGVNGDYYVPDESGYFVLWQYDEELGSYEPSMTEICWKAAGVSAVLDGNVLKLYGVDGAEGEVRIELGPALGSLAFIPDVLSAATFYPTTSEPFYAVTKYFDESKYNSSKVLTAQTDKNNVLKSSVVSMSFRMNPSDTWLPSDENGYYLPSCDFINRAVTTRATGDKVNALLNRESYDLSEKGVVKINASLNYQSLSKDINLVALRMQQSSEGGMVYSDYFQVDCKEISPVLVNTEKVSNGTATVADEDRFYDRNKTLEAGETSDFIQEFVGADDDCHFTLYLNAENPSLDLKPLVGLYVESAKKYLADLNYEGISYTFSKPESYMVGNTDEQPYIALNDGVVTVDKEVNNGTPADGRTPVVRVDAFLNGKLLASAYIKIKISSQPAPDATDKDVNKVPISDEVPTYKYGDLKSSMTPIATMSYWEVSQKIYGAVKLTAATFPNYYDAATWKIEVDGEGVVSGTGIDVAVDIAATDQTTASVEISIDNTILTQHTYNKGEDKNKAKYTVTITIPSKYPKLYGDFVLTQEFYVVDECTEFPIDKLVLQSDNSIHAAGVVEDDKYTLTVDLIQIFAVEGGINNYSGNNISEVEFSWEDPNDTDVTPVSDYSSEYVGTLDEPSVKKTMQYVNHLVNGETCDPVKIDILFENPFVASAEGTVTVTDTNQSGVTTFVGAGLSVSSTKSKQLIYSYDAEAGEFVLENAANAFGVSSVDDIVVTYEWDESNSDYKSLQSSLANSQATFELDSDTGTFTWQNGNAWIALDYNLTIKATVTVGGYYITTCNIPLKLEKAS